MKVHIKDLVNIADEKIYPVDIKSLEVKDNLFLKRIDDVFGDISFYYGPSDELRINYELKGQMICPDAITLEDVAIPFDLSADEIVIHDLNEDGFYFNDSMDLEDMVIYIVSPEAPIKVVKNKKIEYSRGDGWSFVSEEDYESSRKDEIDPRLQKLREYKFEEED